MQNAHETEAAEAAADAADAVDSEDAAGPRAQPPRRVTVEPGGPVVVQGPVEVVAEDGTVSVSRRFAVAICTCRRSATYPWCDTSHRARERPAGHGGPQEKDGTR